MIIAISLDLLLSPIQTVAATHSVDMANGPVPLGHDGFSARCTHITSLLGSGSLCGEIVAKGEASPSDALAASLNTPDERAQLEEPNYTNTGMSYALSLDGTYYWTLLFLEVNEVF
jgi:uncharacterized protein YkwD